MEKKPMKKKSLYTEEQVKEMLNKINSVLPKRASLLIYMIENITEYMTPIQLPSDEEIEKEAHKVIPKFMTDPYNPCEDGNKEDRDVFIEGIKWLREQILNQNK